MNNNKPKVYTYCGEYQNIEQLVLAKPSIETGGDLFGLWLNESTVVLQVIGGPGRNCKRTVHSFFQDVEYLEKTGHHLTQGQGLCNVGEWHSHHQLGLAKPSEGDRGTVWNNLPKLGLPRFMLLIANIRGNDTSPTVNIGAFLFDAAMGEMKEAEFIQLDGSSPFRSNSAVMKVLEIGKEPVEDHGARQGPAVTNKDQTGTANLKDSDGKGLEKPSKKNKNNNNEHANKNKQLFDLSPENNFKLEKEIACEHAESSESISKHNLTAKTAPPEAKREDVGSNTQPKQTLSKKQRKKAAKRAQKRAQQQQRAQNQLISCKSASISSIHASEILEFTSKLCKDLDEPRLVFNKESLFNLNFQITPEDGSGISVSISKSSIASNALPEITLNTDEGMVKEQVVSWPLQEEESQKLTRSLKTKLKTLDKTKQSPGASRWQGLIINIWRIIQTRMRPSNCVIL